jgi:hypothetical protein
MIEAHRPSAWYFGHFHTNQKFLIGETTFRCLAEMAISQVSEAFSAAKGIREDSRAQKPSLLLRPAFWFGSK